VATPATASGSAPGSFASSAVNNLSSCGDDDLSVEEYRAELDETCGLLTEEVTRIPQVVNEENLDLEGARELADDELAELYDALGAQGCAEGQRRTAEELAAADSG
jgi:hypothetical protein